MRKAFTLVELLIVVVVIVTLMSITFRLGAIGSTSDARNRTITRLQRLENCLSGYYAAFGSYPPVPLHGSRNYYLSVSVRHGLQNVDGAENTDLFGWDAEKFRAGTYQEAEDSDWRQVGAACRAQPVGLAHPFPQGFDKFVDAWSEHMREEAMSGSMSESDKQVFANGFDDGVTDNVGRHRAYKDETDWRRIQLFKFGMLSFLLPRYIVMMEGMSSNHRELFEQYAQWTGNNDMPADPMSGNKFMSWGAIMDDVNSLNKSSYARVANIPSQAICSRWLPNLEKIVSTSQAGYRVFGITLTDPDTGGSGSLSSLGAESVYSPGGYESDSTSGQYILDNCTVRDGWGQEFFYYSPAPYQSYVLWSSGPNKRTFPPWVSREDLTAKENDCVSAWTEDDIVNLSH